MSVSKSQQRTETLARLMATGVVSPPKTDRDRVTTRDSDDGDRFDAAGLVSDGSFNYAPTIKPVAAEVDGHFPLYGILTAKGLITATKDEVYRDGRSLPRSGDARMMTSLGQHEAAAVLGRNRIMTTGGDEPGNFDPELVGGIKAIAGTTGGKLYALGRSELKYLSPEGEDLREFDVRKGNTLAVFPNAAPVVGSEAGAIYTLDETKAFSEIVPARDEPLAHLAVTSRSTIVAAYLSGEVVVYDRTGKELGQVEFDGKPTALTTIGEDQWAVATTEGALLFGSARGELIATHELAGGQPSIHGTRDGRLFVGYTDGAAEPAVWTFPRADELEKLSPDQAIDPKFAAQLEADLAQRKQIGDLTQRAEANVRELRDEVEAAVHDGFDPSTGGDFGAHAVAVLDDRWPGIEKKLKGRLHRMKLDKAVFDETPAAQQALDRGVWDVWLSSLAPNLDGGETFEPPHVEPFRPSGATAIERKNRGALIDALVAYEAPADQRDEARLRGLLDTMAMPMLERLSKANYQITVARQRITTAERDLAGKVNGNGGVAVLADLAEGVHRVEKGETPRITVRSYWKNGEIQIDAGTLFHEIGHAFDGLEADRGDALNVEPAFADAFEKEHPRLDAYFHTQAEFFAEVFAYYMLDRERCQRQFPMMFAALNKKFRFDAPDARKIHALQNDMRGEISIDVIPDPRAELDRIEKINSVRLKQNVQPEPYIFALAGEVADATHALADEMGSRLRSLRSPDGARFRPWEATVRIDAATFNDQAAFQKILDDQASTGRGAALYLPELGGLRPEAVGFQLLKRHIERFGGISPLILAGTASQIEALQGALPTVMRRHFDVRGLDGEQTAALIAKTATDEGFVLSTEANQALQNNAPSGNVKSAQTLWRRAKTAHAVRLGAFGDYVAAAPLSVLRILEADVMTAIGDRQSKKPLDELDKMIGLDAPKDEVKAIVAQAKLAARQRELGMPEDRFRLNLMFTGNPGTGKTTVAEFLADALHDIGYLDNNRVAKVRVQDLVVGDPAENVKKLFEENKGGVIFVDEIHQLNDTDAGRRAFRAMIPYLGHKDYLDTVFIGAGYPDGTRDLLRDVDDGAERRFSTVPFEDYNDDQLSEILDVIADRRNKVLDADARRAALDKLNRLRRRMKHFGNGGSIDTVIDAALKKQRTRLAMAHDASELSKEDLSTLIAIDFDDGVPVDREAVWAEIDALDGLDDVKEQLRGIAALVELAEAQGRSPLEFFKPYFVFRGPAGAGRDVVARLMARLLHAYDIIPTSETVEVQGAQLQGRFVGHTTGDVAKIFESAWGGVLTIDGIGGLADAGGAFKKDAVKEMIRQMKENRGRFVMILADDDDGIDAMLDLEPELTALLGETITFGTVSADDAMKTLLSKLSDAVDSSEVLEQLAAGMEALAAAPRWAGFEDARTIGEQIVKAHALEYVARRKKNQPADIKLLAPEVVQRAFAAAIKEKERRGDRKVTEGDGLEYAAEIKVKTAAPKTEEKVEKFTDKDQTLLKAMVKADLEFAALFDADPAEQKRQEADVNSDYIKRIAEELGVKAETAMKNLEAVKVKIRKLVTVESVVKRFEYHCPYCGGVDSPSCGYMGKPMDWKIQHSLKKPWNETTRETKMVESEV